MLQVCNHSIVVVNPEEDLTQMAVKYLKIYWSCGRYYVFIDDRAIKNVNSC